MTEIDWVKLLFSFVYYYPLFMAYVWMSNGLLYYLRWERTERHVFDEPPELREYPFVSVVVPCFNESEHVFETFGQLEKLAYPHYEVIAINDGSSDDTLALLMAAQKDCPHLRIVNFEANQGKAAALRAGALASNGEYLVCLDGDTLLDPHAVTWMMQHFLDGPRVGAVTGNPRVRTRSTLVGKIQVGEFSSIIGLIKRAQRSYGQIFTVSGVISGFRKRALHRVGYWGLDMLTEDIEISWKLQRDHWQIRYEPNALCWVLMPETLKGLWRQRLRWARGGVEVIFRNFNMLTFWHNRRMWLVFLEFVISMIWAYSVIFVVLSAFFGFVLSLPRAIDYHELLPDWQGVTLGLTCLLQFAISLFIDSRYEPEIKKSYFWMIWYPVLYWFVHALTSVVALPMTLFKKKGKRAVWVSPDRGEAFLE